MARLPDPFHARKDGSDFKRPHVPTFDRPRRIHWSLTAVSQACRDTIDREVDPLHHPLVRVAGAMALQELDLHMVERIEIWKTVPDRARQQRIFSSRASWPVMASNMSIDDCHSARSR